MPCGPWSTAVSAVVATTLTSSGTERRPIRRPCLRPDRQWTRELDVHLPPVSAPPGPPATAAGSVAARLAPGPRRRAAGATVIAALESEPAVPGGREIPCRDRAIPAEDERLERVVGTPAEDVQAREVAGDEVGTRQRR